MKKGAFLSAPLTEEVIAQILDMGINEISLGWHNYDEKHVHQLKNAGVKVFAEISLFVGQELWKKYPDSRPIDQDGKPMYPIQWYFGVCPNHPGVRQEKLQIIDHIIKDLDVDGIWLDFIRYPCHWEEVRSTPIAEYCYCEHCLSKFARDVGGKPEGKRWIDWKCKQITGFVEEVHDRIKAANKPIELGLFAVPWLPTDFDEGIKHIICQDFKALSAYIDVFGPMAYHKITGNPTHWVSDIVKSIFDETAKSVVPLVQSIPTPVTISVEDFSSAVAFGMQPPANGVMVFHFEDMVSDAGKYKALKTVFNPGI